MDLTRDLKLKDFFYPSIVSRMLLPPLDGDDRHQITLLRRETQRIFGSPRTTTGTRYRVFVYLALPSHFGRVTHLLWDTATKTSME